MHQCPELLYAIPPFFNIPEAVHNVTAQMKPNIQIYGYKYIYVCIELTILSYAFFLKHSCGCFNIAAMSYHHHGAFKWDSS